MNFIIDLEKIISQEWKSFSHSSTAECSVREIQKPIDYDLLTNLKASYFFKDKTENIPKMAPKRQAEWAEARRVELALEKRYKRMSGPHSSTLLSSISHTRNESLGIVAGVSCLIGSNEKVSIQNIGIDLEFNKRKLPTELVQRFFDEEEIKKYSLSPLEIWVLREAALKATPRDLQLVVTQYSLSDWDEQTQTGVMISKNAKCNVKLFTHTGVNIGLSYFKY